MDNNIIQHKRKYNNHTKQCAYMKKSGQCDRKTRTEFCNWHKPSNIINGRERSKLRYRNKC
jgi:hypothetical protein